jgi:phage terminase small subunit
MNNGAQKNLTQKQKCFVEQYLIDLNATQAAIRAGYSRKTAMEQGYQLLQKTSVSSAIQDAMQERSRRTQITQDRVLEELMAIGFANIYDAFSTENGRLGYKSIDEFPENIQKAILEIAYVPAADGTTKITRLKLACKVKALGLIVRHLGLLNVAKRNRRSSTDLNATCLLKKT